MDQPLNIHPLLVHFPVALFTIYAVMELVRWKKILEKPYWFYVKAAIVIIGTLTSYLTLISGKMIEDMFTKSGLGPLVELHQTFAITTVSIFTILALAYAIAWYNKDFAAIPKINLATKFQSLVLNTPVVWILALLGLISVTITGSLGGALAYGPELDPMVSFVYHLFFKK